MRVEFHISVYDEDEAARLQEPGQIGLSVRGATVAQIDALILHLDTTLRKLREHRMKKYGRSDDARIIGPDGAEGTKTAGAWTPEDEADLAQENATADGLTPSELPE